MRVHTSRAVDAHGTLDMVVNNAGYGLFGMVEEATEAQVRAQLEVNFFGALRVTQAVAPVGRQLSLRGDRTSG
ncbi:SDR family NAD(P)-dependent oxidoreductase [Catenuloplanes sp. NPDC051500]|uniref:SDR family NAD(P)-dependent oxidoreductase n=1 Tax=Catenuloplanes sp. NPDC051500 TaxID=3363959 RepID=UPI00379C2C14